jgi:hypothetical protein
MSKAMCGKCGVRFAQSFDPPRCCGCISGRRLSPPANFDYSPAEIDRRFARALREIQARNRPEPSREYRG